MQDDSTRPTDPAPSQRVDGSQWFKLVPITLSSKRYILVCAGCDLLFDATRRDQITCSGACRVKAHRNGEIKRLKVIAKHYDIKVSHFLQARAIKRLCPELAVTLDQPPEEVCRAFDTLVARESAR
jgi:hypothetical protein